ncbi:MAG: glycosyltransferase family 2 protein [Candidatus Eisenbacteria bacterium]|uniref:Glycosyltransferase family 2 protein n=1 Tax=Eiseniibacteriota bacterium TaxID=2212470 RepID=A0A538U1T1_UNCEI|nr:MAG: glycosyltransferase family 2 protein [Candidatus Eisenbacteria bacterium]
MKPPSVAVILITRDRPVLLADALGSVTTQTSAPLEVRIADDGDDPAAEVVAGAGLLEVTVVDVDVRNPAAARNRAAAGARADVLAFLDDDDRWRPTHLEGLQRAFADPECGLAYRDCLVVKEQVIEGGKRVDLERRPIARDWTPAIMAENDYVPPSAFAVRRSWFERLGGFDESFSCSEDWDFLLRAARLGTPRRVPGVTVEIRMREHGQASRDMGPGRRAALDLLSARHGLPRLEIKTFWEVAADVGVSEESA